MKKKKLVILELPQPTFTIGCGCGIAGEDKSVEYIVKKGGTRLTMYPFEMRSACERLCESIIRVNKQLNDLKKQKDMKNKACIKVWMKEDTEFKLEVNNLNASDFEVPEGYQIIVEPNPKGIVYILKKKEVKDFNWYCEQYQKDIKFYSKDEFGQTHLSSELPTSELPFEIKIGLLKFICDDLGIEIFNYIGLRQKEGEFDKITSICPIEFLNSIFK